jgi:tryptophan 2,3-dioxygenase
MNKEIYGIWYKHSSNITNSPQMAYMIRLEGIESYGLYMQFADMLHTIGGYQEYDFKKISLMLGHTKKNIKTKLERVINDYELFEFYTEEDGIEMIGLERLKEDIASLNKHKENGAKGGKKRAENYRDRQEQIKPVTENIETVTSKADAPSEIYTNDDLKLPEAFLRDSIELQKIKVKQMVKDGKFKSKGERGVKILEMMIKHIKSQE